MLFTSWLRNLGIASSRTETRPFADSRCPREKARRRRRATRPLHVEALEDRCLLATGLGAALVADIDPGTDSSSPHHLVNANGTLFFYASFSFGDRSRVLWKSDGTAAGTVAIASSLPSLPELAAIGGTVFYNTVNGLSKTDGTTRALVKQYVVGSNFTPANDQLFFTSSGGGNGNELWMSDGTEKGTFEVKDIHRGTERDCTTYPDRGARRHPRGPKCRHVPNDSNPWG